MHRRHRHTGEEKHSTATQRGSPLSVAPLGRSGLGTVSAASRRSGRRCTSASLTPHLRCRMPWSSAKGISRARVVELQPRARPQSQRSNVWCREVMLVLTASLGGCLLLLVVVPYAANLFMPSFMPQQQAVERRQRRPPVAPEARPLLSRARHQWQSCTSRSIAEHSRQRCAFRVRPARPARTLSSFAPLLCSFARSSTTSKVLASSSIPSSSASGGAPAATHTAKHHRNRATPVAVVAPASTPRNATCVVFLHTPKTGGTPVTEIFQHNRYVIRRAHTAATTELYLKRTSRCKAREILEIQAGTPQLWEHLAAARARVAGNGDRLLVFTLWREPMDLVQSTCALTAPLPPRRPRTARKLGGKLP